MLLPNDALVRIDEIKKSGKKLNSWEKGFLASIGIQAKQGRYLHTTQSDKLNQIHQRLAGVHGR